MARHSLYWVIVSGAQPTAFRARLADDLLPTLRQLQRTQSDVSLKWFERGRFWESPAHAREAQEQRRRESAKRGQDWRPGGTHKDPRAKFQISRDERRARFKQRLAKSRRESDVNPGSKDDAADSRRPRTAPPRRPRPRTNTGRGRKT